MNALERSRALWNRRGLELASDEVLAQLLDQGEMEAWRTLYALAADDPALRRRIARIVTRVPLAFPHAWLAAMASLGEAVDMEAPMVEERGC